MLPREQGKQCGRGERLRTSKSIVERFLKIRPHFPFLAGDLGSPEGTQSLLRSYRESGLHGFTYRAPPDGSLSSSCCAIVIDHRKPRCFWHLFDDKLNLRIAENALQRATFAKNSDTFLCWYRERTQAISAGDYVILSIAGHPDRRLVPLDCWTRRSLLRCRPQNPS